MRKEYYHHKVLMELANIVRAGKADTIKEAINVLCEENHRSTMEFQAMVTAENSKKAASRAGVAAFNSGASAAFSAANFFFK